MHLVELPNLPDLAEARAELQAAGGPWIDLSGAAPTLLARAEALAEGGRPGRALLRRVARDMASIAVIQAALAGDRAALERLLELWRADVLRWCRMLCRPGVPPEDAAADALTIVVTDLRKVADPGRFRAWLWAVTWRTVRGYHRRAFLRRWVPGLLPDGPDLGTDTGRRYELSERSARVRAVLSGLGAEQAELLWLSYAEGLTRAELAAQLDLPEGTLSRKLSRARAAFEAAAREAGLAPEGQEEGGLLALPSRGGP